MVPFYWLSNIIPMLWSLSWGIVLLEALGNDDVDAKRLQGVGGPQGTDSDAVSAATLRSQRGINIPKPIEGNHF